MIKIEVPDLKVCTVEKISDFWRVLLKREDEGVLDVWLWPESLSRKESDLMVDRLMEAEGGLIDADFRIGQVRKINTFHMIFDDFQSSKGV